MLARFPRVILTVPFVPQRNHGECLVACAAMALAHLGRQVDYQRLARVIDLTPIGTPFPNIRRLASSSLHVHVRHGDLQVLYDHLQRGQPCVASVQADHLPHWRGEDFAHAVVVVGMDEDFVYLHDPAVAIYPLRVGLGDFDLAWLERDEEFAVFTPA
jgi:ABC-type bacteriocin/lantibiotic exporter with double-glycine peptidase domain